MVILESIFTSIMKKLPITPNRCKESEWKHVPPRLIENGQLAKCCDKPGRMDFAYIQFWKMLNPHRRK